MKIISIPVFFRFFQLVEKRASSNFPTINSMKLLQGPLWRFHLWSIATENNGKGDAFTGTFQKTDFH